MFYSSNWGQKSKTRVSYWWSCISLIAHVLGVKCVRSPIIHSSTYRHSLIYNPQCENSFCLASDPQRKTSVSHASRFEKRSNSPQPVFRPEVPPAPSTRKWPAREAKFNLKYYTGWNAKSYINIMYIYLNVCKQMTDVKLLLLHSNTWNHLTVCK